MVISLVVDNTLTEVEKAIFNELVGIHQNTVKNVRFLPNVTPPRFVYTKTVDGRDYTLNSDGSGRIIDYGKKHFDFRKILENVHQSFTVRYRYTPVGMFPA